MRTKTVLAMQLSNLLAVIMMSACGGGNTSLGTGNPPLPTTTEVLYATSYGVLTYGVNASTGMLSSPTTIAGANGAYGIATTPSQKYLYTNNRPASAVDGYSIGQSGSLTAITGSPFPLPVTSTPLNIDALAMHPSGRFLYTVETGANAVAGFEIDASTGALTPIAASPFATGNTPQGAVVDPSGRFLYVSTYAGISAFTIDSTTGILTAIQGSPFPAPGGSEGLAIHPSGKFLFVASLGVEVFSIDSTTGTLTTVQAAPFPLVDLAWSVALHPTGSFLYTAAGDDGRIFGYRIGPTTGELTPLTGSPFGLQGALGLSTLIVDPSGKFLYAAGAACNGVLSYQIDTTTGSLIAITPTGNPTGKQQIGSYPLGLTALVLR